MSASTAEIIHEAARLICHEGFVDYAFAKRRAADNLGLQIRTGPVDNTLIEASVLEMQESSGGDEYRTALQQMRETAIEAMKFLAGFEPRLAGSAASGAIGIGHRVQIHVHDDFPESVEMKFHSLGIPFIQAERRYSTGKGNYSEIPLIQFEVDNVGVDVAVFSWDFLRRPPDSQVTGRPAKRLDAQQVAKLIAP